MHFDGDHVFLFGAKSELLAVLSQKVVRCQQHV